MAAVRCITRWCYSRARSCDIGSTFVPWTVALTSQTIIAAVTAPGEVSGAVDFSESFTTDQPRERAGR
jgi:hypothetical protein